MPEQVARAILRGERDDVATYLLVQERKASAVGRWTSPGGNVNPGESGPRAAEREAAEEVGLDVVVDEEPLRVLVTPDGRFEISWYLGRVLGGELRPNQEELLDADWFEPEQVRELERNGSLRDSEVLDVIEAAERLYAHPRH
jgi:8-oxo-dGTP pyrophosphatase MutT (NUDIX family)